MMKAMKAGNLKAANVPTIALGKLMQSSKRVPAPSGKMAAAASKSGYKGK